MDNRFLPSHLAGYDLFGSLHNWMAGDPHRTWTLRPYRGRYHCELAWKIGGQFATLNRYAPTPEEAVWAALEWFSNPGRNP